ncbi:hypothetical protein U9M48_016847, partial [Paspalum notatum var. saurae]
MMSMRRWGAWSHECVRPGASQVGWISSPSKEAEADAARNGSPVFSRAHCCRGFMSVQYQAEFRLDMSIMVQALSPLLVTKQRPTLLSKKKKKKKKKK